MFLEISQNSQENTCARVSFLRPATLLKTRLWHRCFPVSFMKFLRTSFLQNTLGRLLPYSVIWASYLNIDNCKLELHHRRIFYHMLRDSIHLVYPGKNKAQGKIFTVVIIRDREVFGKFKKKYEKSVDLKMLFLFFF